MRPILLATLLFSAAWLSAQAPQPAHHVEKLSEHAAVLIDGQFGRSAPGRLEAVRTVTKNPIRYLIDTHHAKAHSSMSPKEQAGSFDTKAWADYKPIEGFVTW